MTEAEMRAYTCPRWHVWSPRWPVGEDGRPDMRAAVENPKTELWEAIVDLSAPKSAAWVKERFPGCRIEPLFASDLRQGNARLETHRKRAAKVRGKKSYVPSSDEVSAS